MKPYFPFYKSLRFRFGAIFGGLLLCSLLVIGIFLYFRVKAEFESGFYHLMNEQASVVLAKVELNPLTLPAPQPQESFSLFYEHGRQTDTLFRYAQKKQGAGSAGFTRSVVRRRTLETGGAIRIDYSLDSQELEAQITELRSIVFIYFPLAFVCAVLAGYFLSNFLLRPLSRIITRANETSLQDEIRLLPLPAVEDELHQLTFSFNRMLERIRDQSEQETAFFASAAHELRTPLSLMLTELQVLNLSSLPDELKTVVGHQVSEVKRLSALVNMFLLMSRVKAAPGMLAERKALSLQDELMDLLPLFQQRAMEKEIVFRVELIPLDADFTIIVNPEHLRVMLTNLLENALKFGSGRTPVSVVISRQTTGTKLEIVNETTEASVDIQKIKERFVKGSTRTDGFGLGLFIVELLAKANQATLNLRFQEQLFTASLEFVR